MPLSRSVETISDLGGKFCKVVWCSASKEPENSADLSNVKVEFFRIPSLAGTQPFGTNFEACRDFKKHFKR